MTISLVGIDPGKTGAIAIVTDSDITIHDCPLLKLGKSKTDFDPGAMADLLRSSTPATTLVAVERVASRPGQGVASTFTFGTNYGLWQGILAALALPYDLVTPQAWHKVVMNGQSKDKDASLQVAYRLFPHMRERIGRNHNRAEALLLAEYLRRTRLIPPQKRSPNGN